MKKLVLFFAVAFAMSFVSCDNKKAVESTETVDSMTVTVDTVAIDTVVADTVVADSVK